MPAKELPEPVNPLWIFIDESGNFDFSPSGTRHFLMTAVVTADPAASGARMLALKYEQMLRGSNQLDFHATHNSRGTRKRVLEVIGGMPGVTSHTFVADKAKLRDSPSPQVEVVELIAHEIGTWAVVQASQHSDGVIAVFDTAFNTNQTSHLRQAVKKAIGAGQMPYRIHFHRVANEPNGQIADYIAWAHFRNLARGDDEGLRFLSSAQHTMTFIK
jgi:hypothetical protein